MRWLGVRAVRCSGAVEAQEGFRVFAQTWPSGAEVDLGVAPVVWTPAADGIYLLRFETLGGFWRAAPAPLLAPQLVSLGVPGPGFPVIMNPTIVAVAGGRYVSWTYTRQFKERTPATWSIWTSATFPVAVGGAPTTTIPATGEGIYGVFLAGSTASYAAIGAS